MTKMRAAASGFDGVKSYEAGEVVETSADHARLAIVQTGAELLGADDKPVTAIEDVEKHLGMRLRDHERALFAARAKARDKKKGV